MPLKAFFIANTVLGFMKSLQQFSYASQVEKAMSDLFIIASLSAYDGQGLINETGAFQNHPQSFTFNQYTIRWRLSWATIA